MLVRVGVAVAVLVRVGVAVGPLGVAVRVGVAVGVLVRVGVAVAPPPAVKVRLLRLKSSPSTAMRITCWPALRLTDLLIFAHVCQPPVLATATVPVLSTPPNSTRKLPLLAPDATRAASV